jgi:hypothetical protein
MPITVQILVASGLLAATVMIHAVALAALVRSVPGARLPAGAGFWPGTLLLIRVACALTIIHLVGIAVWAGFYWWQECLPDGESAFYFAAVTYTTIGYGDLLLPREWRLLAPIEGLTGILMCGLSAAFFFAVVSKMIMTRDEEDKV